MSEPAVVAHPCNSSIWNPEAELLVFQTAGLQESLDLFIHSPCVCVCVACIHVEGQLMGIRFLLLPGESWESNSDHQTWLQKPLHTKPSFSLVLETEFYCVVQDSLGLHLVAGIAGICQPCHNSFHNRQHTKRSPGTSVVKISVFCIILCVWNILFLNVRKNMLPSRNKY